METIALCTQLERPEKQNQRLNGIPDLCDTGAVLYIYQLGHEARLGMLVLFMS